MEKTSKNMIKKGGQIIEKVMILSEVIGQMLFERMFHENKD